MNRKLGHLLPDPLPSLIVSKYCANVSFQLSFQVSGCGLDCLAKLEKLIGDVRPEEHSVITANNQIVGQRIEFM